MIFALITRKWIKNLLHKELILLNKSAKENNRNFYN